MSHERPGAGWREDSLFHAIHHFAHGRFRRLLHRIGFTPKVERRRKLPSKIDLREWCSPVQFQGPYNTCSAHVVAGMVEFLERRFERSTEPMSRLFLHQVAHRLMNDGTGDGIEKGVFLRQIMETLALFGVPPESFWPYLETSRVDDPRLRANPDAFCFALARRYSLVRYCRIDKPGLDPQSPPKEREKFLRRLKSMLVCGRPCTLGFPVYEVLMSQVGNTGDLPWQDDPMLPLLNHSALVVGYDDRRIIRRDGAYDATTGALLFKSSSGDKWGIKGYGWLPYEYVLQGRATDCWAILEMKWADTKQFQPEVGRGASD